MHKITGTVKDYTWGSPTAIPQILGTEPDGRPQAEYWLGAHPSSPSTVHVDGTAHPMDSLLADRPELLGAASRQRFGDALPFLVKILAAQQQLSLQAHPSREQAVAGFAEENRLGIPLDDPTRTYRDAWPKPEIMAALGPFDALYGFRDPAASMELFRQIPLTTRAHHDAMHRVLASLDEPQDPALAVRRTFLTLLRLPDSDLVTALTDCAGSLVDAPGELGLLARTATALSANYPGDPGVLAALLMNRITMQRFDAVFVPAGLMHAYIHGTGVEVMASSDNVLRGGLTNKHIDIDGLADVVDFSPTAPSLVQRREVAEGLWEYLTPAPEFTVRVAEAPPAPLVVPGEGRARIILQVEGEMELQLSTGEIHPLPRGAAAFLTAQDRVTMRGGGTAFIASSGV